MKSIFISTGLAAMTVLALLTSCNSTKKIQAATTPTQKVKKETTEIHREPTTDSVIPKNIETETAEALPPSLIEHKFTDDHGSATIITWAKETDTAITKEFANTNYKALYIESGKKNWITYTETGAIVEERHEIVVAQLPQNIYNSIKKEYPDNQIVSASTYKHLRAEGSYAVVIKPVYGTDSQERELIVRENGTVVE